MIQPMVTLAEIESLAFKLPESDRAKLAAGLLDSLPGVLVEDDEGLAALGRSRETERDPFVCLSPEIETSKWKLQNLKQSFLAIHAEDRCIT